MNFKNILIVILIVVVLAVLGTIVFSQVNSDIDTQINFLSGNALNSGDNVTFELKDVQGNPLANENVNIKYTKDNQTQTFTITTDSEGRGYLTLDGEEAGICTVIVNFEGDDKYNPSSATQSITIGDVTVESASQDTYYDSSSSAGSSSDSSSDDSSSDSSSSDELNYDSDLNLYYDNDGVIKGGQNDGQSYEYIKNNPPEVDENGNLN